MRYLVILLSVSIVFTSCASNRAANKASHFITESGGAQNYGTFRGTVKDAESGEAVIHATVLVEGTQLGAVTDMDGFFQISTIPPGQYNVTISLIGFEEVRLENIPIEAGKIVSLDKPVKMNSSESQVIELKPMIYLYPEDTMDINVQLSYDGEIMHTYPKTKDSWKVKASPDGTLVDEKGRSYYGLFWEGEPNQPIEPKSGTIVSKDSLIPFLEASLDQLGLNYKEANEFIVFWLPILEQSEYNLIYFASDDYTDHAQLNITPQPDNIIRVMMGYVPLDTPIDFPQQVLPEVPDRSGFTAVEWGGTRCYLPNL